jgi:hypothetical protein
VEGLLGRAAVRGEDVLGLAGVERKRDVLAAAPLEIEAVLFGVAAEVLEERFIQSGPRRDIDLGELDAVGPVHDRPLEELERGEVKRLEAVAVDPDLELSHGSVRRPHHNRIGTLLRSPGP